MLKIFLSFCVGLSVQAWGLTASLPVTLSVTEPEQIFEHSKVAVNNRGDAAVIWSAASNESDKRTLKFASKKANERWQGFERISQEHADIGAFGLVVDEKGKITVSCSIADDDKSFSLFQVLQKAGHIWSCPLYFRINENKSVSTSFALSNQGEAMLVKTNVTQDAASLQTMSASFQGLDAQMVDIFTASRDLSLPRLFAGEDGSLAAFWLSENKCYCTVYRAGKWTEIQEVCDVPGAVFYFTAAVGNQGEMAVCFEMDSQIYAAYFEDNSWSPLVSIAPLFQPQHTPAAVRRFSEEPGLAVDEQGNAMIIWGAGNGAKPFNVTYKAQGQESVVLELPRLPGRNFNGKIKNDHIGNFVAVWQNVEEKEIAVYCAAYSTKTGWWTDPVRLSPDKIVCMEPDFAINSDGQGIVSWHAHFSPEDQRIQVVHLNTKSEPMAFCAPGTCSRHGR